MKPYYQDDWVTIFNADSGLEMMAGADLIITDPPYGMNFRSNHRTVKHSAIIGDSCLPVEIIQKWVGSAAKAAYVFCRWDNLADMPKPKSVLAWVKNNWSMGDLKHEHGRQWEAICFYPGPNHAFIKRIPDVLYADRTGNDLHPTEKPESIIKQLIQANEGDLIIDPFMGSGTTLRAAKDLKRHAIGIEIEEKYCEVAAKRMAQEVLL